MEDPVENMKNAIMNALENSTEKYKSGEIKSNTMHALHIIINEQRLDAYRDGYVDGYLDGRE